MRCLKRLSAIHGRDDARSLTDSPPHCEMEASRWDHFFSVQRSMFGVRCSVFDVRCSMFRLLPLSTLNAHPSARLRDQRFLNEIKMPRGIALHADPMPARSVEWTRIGIAPAAYWVFHCDMNSHVCSRRRFLRTTSILTVGAPFALSTAANIVSGAEPAAKSFADAKVAIASCKIYGSQEIHAAYGQCFDLLGGVGSLVKGKTATIKINLTGTDFTPFLNRPVGETYMTHEATAQALAAALFKAGAKRIVFVESTQSRASLEGTLGLADWDVKALSALGEVQYENTRNLGSAKSYAHIKVPTGGLMFSSFDVN